jgi:hypothetical protein
MISSADGVLLLLFEILFFGVPAAVVIHAWRTRLSAAHKLHTVLRRVAPPGFLSGAVLGLLLIRLLRAGDPIEHILPRTALSVMEFAVYAAAQTWLWRGIVHLIYPPQEAVR